MSGSFNDMKIVTVEQNAEIYVVFYVMSSFRENY
jgi:hypothetical protein